MKENIKYDIGDSVTILNHKNEKITGIISMITVNRKGIRYRGKFGFDCQYNFWQDEIID